MLSLETSQTNHCIPRRVLGRTGIEASILGYGSHISEEVVRKPGEREAQIHYALDHGINFFDVYADFGGYERMSSILGPVRKDVVISIFMPDVEDPLGEFEKVLKTFRCEQIDMVRMWSGGPSHESPHQERMYADLVKGKEQGKIRVIGLSSHSEDDFMFELAFRRFDYALVIYNFHEHCDHYPRLMPLARREGMALIGMKPFAMGSLIKFAEKIRTSEGFEDIPGVSVPIAALKYVYQNPDIAMALPSMYSMAEIVENLKAFSDLRLSADEATLLRRISEAAGPERCMYDKFQA